MRTELEILQGVVTAVIYQNYDNGYAVLRMQCTNGDTITVVGAIPLAAVGERLIVTGKWNRHASYGQQFEAEFLERLLPQSAQDIQAYLSGRAIRGIGPVLAARIVAHFGEDTLNIIEKAPERLAEITGISPKKAQQIGNDFRSQFGMRHLMEIFTLHHLPAEFAVSAYNLYGENAVDLIYDDPYLLVSDELDAPFNLVDHFAIELGFAGDDPRRVRAGIIFELRYNLSAGHSFLPLDKLINATSQLLSVATDVIIQCICEMIEVDRLVGKQLAGIDVVYLPELYDDEIYCTQHLLALAEAHYPKPTNLEKLTDRIARNSKIQYSAQQKAAIQAAATSGVLLITGGPGTGKTTIINGILSLFDEMDLSCVLAAPTGRAAKRLTEVTGRDASTIHRLLEVGLDHRSGKLYFTKNIDNPIKADVIIVDEMSMVDIQLLSALLDAVSEESRVILVGDPDQLPPVGPGFPFMDMLRSGVLPAVRLTEVFRQAQKSLIVVNAHRVNRGEMPELNNVKKDFFFLPAQSEQAVEQTIVGLCATRLPTKMGIPAEQIQVLSPTKRGASGTANLNKRLQESLNPPAPNKRERMAGDWVFREGDRVMQIRNNYDIMWKKTDGSEIGSGVFNGDIGIIRCIDSNAEQMTVVFDDREVDYDFSQLNELELAYALTVHKSQGSEYRAVVLSAWNCSPYLLNRSILYTAITRAKELLIIVGKQETITAMTENVKVSRRYSGLKLRLQRKED